MRLVLCFQCLLIIITGYSQSIPDISSTEKHRVVGDSLYEAGQFRSSIEFLKKVVETSSKHNSDSLMSLLPTYLLLANNYTQLAEERIAIEYVQAAQSALHDHGNHPLKWAQTEITLAKAYLSLVQYDSAEYSLQKAKELLTGSEKENYQEMADWYEVKGDILLDQEDVKALGHYFKSLEIQKDLGNNKKIAILFRKLCSTYSSMADHNQAKLYGDSSLTLTRELWAGDHLQHGKALHQLGVVHTRLNQFDKALTQLDQAHKILENYYPKHHPAIIRSYKMTGHAHYYKGDFVLALDFYQQAIKLARQKWGEYSPYVSLLYNDIGNVYFEIRESQKGMEYRLKGLAVTEKTFGPNHANTALVYFNTGLNYLALGRDSLALYYIRKSLLIRENIHGTNHYYVADCYGVMAGIYRYRGQLTKALAYYKRALEICQKIYWKDQRIVYCHYYIGMIHLELNNLDSAIQSIHNSIVYNIISFNNSDPASQPPPHGFVSKNMLPVSMTQKAELFRQKYNRDRDIADLENSLLTYQVYDSMVEKIRRSLLRGKDKMALGQKLTRAYEGAIEVCTMLFNQTQDPEYHNLSLYFSERNKSAILIESMAGEWFNQKELAPKTLLELEQKTKREIETKRNELISSKNGNNLKDSIALIEQDIFRLQRMLDSLELKMDSLYPDFYPLKHLPVKSIHEIQKALSAKELFIEFFAGEKDIYVFGISPTGFHLAAVRQDSVFNDHLNRFLQNFSGPEKGKKINIQEYASLSFSLYETLLKETLDYFESREDILNLIIIPDGRLNYIPFEALTQEKMTKTASGFSDLNYLVRNFSICYSYSSAMTFRKPKAPVNYDYLAFAPSYDQPLNSDQQAALGKFRDAIIPLAWNLDEVKTTAEKLNGSYYLNQDASETMFKKKASEYGILHLAMHALIDDQDPMNSKFVFATNADDRQDGYLHAFELYNMKLNADLVVLSACNTGYGPLAKGEGIMSLARGFSNAGVSNLITSLWQVADQPASDLIIRFFVEAEKGLPYARSLQQAKLKYLELADANTANPFYWSAFVFVGHPNGAIKASDIRWIWIIPGLFVILLAAVFTLMLRAKPFLNRATNGR